MNAYAYEFLLLSSYQATNDYNFSLTRALLRQLPTPVLGISDGTNGNDGVTWSSLLSPAPSPHWNIPAWNSAVSAVMQKSFGLKPGSLPHFFPYSFSHQLIHAPELMIIFGDYGLRASSPHPPSPTPRSLPLASWQGGSCERHDWPFTQGGNFFF